jgi:hypothetical protein
MTSNSTGKITVINRMHPDEWPGDQVDEMFSRLHIPGVQFVTRDVPEAHMRSRGIEPGINTVRCFPGRPDGNRDEQWAWQVTEFCRDSALVLDIHGVRRGRGRSYPFTSAESWSSPLVRGVASLVGSTWVQFIPAPHPVTVLPNCVGADLALSTSFLDELPGLLRQLSQGWVPPTRTMKAYRITGGVKASEAKAVGLKRRYEQLERLPDEAARRLGLPVPAHAIGWDADTLEPLTGYWGDVMTTA